jgi:hypothetical protein
MSDAFSAIMIVGALVFRADGGSERGQIRARGLNVGCLTFPFDRPLMASGRAMTQCALASSAPA